MAQTAQETTLSELAKRVKITSQHGQARKPWEKMEEWQQNANNYRVTLRYQGRQMSLDFWRGIGIHEPPDSARVLNCLLSDSTACDMDFDEWCGELGYDTDSRKAERTYNLCQKQGERLKRLLGDDYELFLYAENDV